MKGMKERENNETQLQSKYKRFPIQTYVLQREAKRLERGYHREALSQAASNQYCQ